jgi:hypothetical protein
MYVCVVEIREDSDLGVNVKITCYVSRLAFLLLFYDGVF